MTESAPATPTPATPTPAATQPPAAEVPPSLQAVSVAFEHSIHLTGLLEALNCSLLLTTYQAGRVVSLGSHQGALRVAFARFDQAMGLTRTPTGLAIGCRDAIWSLPANLEIAPSLQPEGEHDIAFLARTSHHTGPVMVHDLAWGGDRLWMVNTLFNCLAIPEPPWSFQPAWTPPFIAALAPGDRCHLNGLAMAEDGTAPAWVTALSETDQENGWREHKATSGCLIHVPSGERPFRGLCMPHSPRLHQGQLLLLESGTGSLLRLDPRTGGRDIVATLPGFTRGMDCFGGYAFIGLSQIRETAVFGGLPLREREQELRCGLAIIELASGKLAGFLWFHSGVEEIFSVSVLPGWRNPVILGPDTQTDQTQTVWLVPPASL